MEEIAKKVVEHWAAACVLILAYGYFSEQGLLTGWLLLASFLALAFIVFAATLNWLSARETSLEVTVSIFDHHPNALISSGVSMNSNRSADDDIEEIVVEIPEAKVTQHSLVRAPIQSPVPRPSADMTDILPPEVWNEDRVIQDLNRLAAAGNSWFGLERYLELARQKKYGKQQIEVLEIAVKHLRLSKEYLGAKAAIQLANAEYFERLAAHRANIAKHRADEEEHNLRFDQASQRRQWLGQPTTAQKADEEEQLLRRDRAAMERDELRRPQPAPPREPTDEEKAMRDVRAAMGRAKTTMEMLKAKEEMKKQYPEELWPHIENAFTQQQIEIDERGT